MFLVLCIVGLCLLLFWVCFVLEGGGEGGSCFCFFRVLVFEAEDEHDDGDEEEEEEEEGKNEGGKAGVSGLCGE